MVNSRARLSSEGRRGRLLYILGKSAWKDLLFLLWTLDFYKPEQVVNAAVF